MDRRVFLQNAGCVIAALGAAGFLRPGSAIAAEWNKPAFGAKDLRELVRVLGGQDGSASGDVSIHAPDIAENGAVVPVSVRTTLPAESIAILVEKNPSPVAAIFELPSGTLPEIQTRVKMAETSNVVALVKAGGRFHYAVREIKVTLGGCGG
jgi:sulfur-oxidizing protein SoxY